MKEAIPRLPFSTVYVIRSLLPKAAVTAGDASQKGRHNTSTNGRDVTNGRSEGGKTCGKKKEKTVLAAQLAQLVTGTFSTLFFRTQRGSSMLDLVGTEYCGDRAS